MATTVYHPSFFGVSENVSDKDVKDWTDAGWRKTPLADADAPTDAGAPAAK